VGRAKFETKSEKAYVYDEKNAQDLWIDVLSKMIKEPPSLGTGRGRKEVCEGNEKLISRRHEGVCESPGEFGLVSRGYKRWRIIDLKSQNECKPRFGG
jgi:hypothetical protein